MRKRNMWLAAAAAAAVIGGSGLAAGCSSPQTNDQGGIQQASADYALTYLNADGFPNITMLCIRGVGFATTTRDYTSLMRITQWDAFCATKVRAQQSLQQNPATGAFITQSHR